MQLLKSKLCENTEDCTFPPLFCFLPIENWKQHQHSSVIYDASGWRNTRWSKFVYPPTVKEEGASFNPTSPGCHQEFPYSLASNYWQRKNNCQWIWALLTENCCTNSWIKRPLTAYSPRCIQAMGLLWIPIIIELDQYLQHSAPQLVCFTKGLIYFPYPISGYNSDAAKKSVL